MHQFGHTCKLLQLTLSTKLQPLVCHFATHASRPLIHPDITNWFLIIFDFETEHKNVTVKWILIHNEWKPDSPYSLASHPPRPHRAATSGKIFIALFSLWTNSFSLNIVVISFPCSASFPCLFGGSSCITLPSHFVVVILLIFVSFCANHHFLL